MKAVRGRRAQPHLSGSLMSGPLFSCRRLVCCLAMAAWLCHPSFALAIKAFPQAEGFGAEALGGRGGDVYHVTKLTDDGSVGTLRHGVESSRGPRTIVFDVGGWIDLNSKLGVDTNKNRITIAGQTAPGGIGVRGHQFSVGGDDIVVRHMRFRPGKDSGRNDSVNTNNNAERVIYDHISAGFSYDENFSVQATDVTLQFSSVNYGLQDHSAGSLLENPHRLTMHHNLYAHNNTRNPKHRVQETLDWVDNVIYNWDARAFYMEGTSSSGYFWTSNIDGNYFIAGPDTGGTKPLSGGSVDDYGTWWGVNAFDGDKDNVHDGTDYPFAARNFYEISSALTTWSGTPYPVSDEVWKEASTQAAYERVLREFGATPWDRDEVDELLHSNVVNRTGGIISHESQLVAQGVSNGGFGTLGGVAAPLDSDGDGMPDAWEVKHGADPFVASNNNDFDQDGYTDLEEYLNDLAAFKATGPIEFIGNGAYESWQNWTRRWEPSRVDDVHIDVGIATVSSVGQRAGTLRLGASAGSDGELRIDGGWLEVTDDVEIGPGGEGALMQSGGELRVLNGGVHIENGVYTLTGGRLVTPELSRGAMGEFNLRNSGELQADHVSFDLTNSGGVITPGGDGVGQTEVQGNLILADGELRITLASPTQNDRIVVEGLSALGAGLEVVLADGFAPLSGSWEIMSAGGGFTGDFGSVTAGYSLRQAGDSLFLELDATLLPGDYNSDGRVDAADYTLWRDHLGDPAGTLANDTTGDVIGAAQYNLWRSNYGATRAGASGAADSVPEPDAALLMILGVCGFRGRRRSPSSQTF